MLLLEDRRFYCYIYLDTRKPGNYNYLINDKNYHFDYEPFYVGEGKCERMYDHLEEAKTSNRSTYKLNKIRKIWKEGCDPIILKLESFLTKKESLQLEEDFIKAIKFISDGGYLTNMLSKGRDPIYSKEHRQILSSQRKNKSYKEIYKNPEEWKKNHSIARKGDNNPMHRKGGHTEKTKLKISKNRLENGIGKGEKNPMYGKKRPDLAERNRSQRGKTIEEIHGEDKAKETKEKMSKSRKGRKNPPISEESRKNMSNAQKRKWELIKNKEEVDE